MRTSIYAQPTGQILKPGKPGSLKPPGTHIFIDEKLESAFRKKLNAEGGYPTYVIIDQKGNIGTDKISFMTELNKEALKKKTGVE